MTDEDKLALAAEIADELLDSATLETAADRQLAARCVADRIEPWLQQQGWMPPATYDRISDWVTQTLKLPEHHINRSVLNSQLGELTAILHDR